MAEQNTNQIDTLAGTKAALVTDLNSSYIGKDQYSHARNLVRNSKDGDIGTLGNEPSNTLCVQAPYKIVGTVDLPDDTVMVFSGDGSNSEIGIADTAKCTYTAVKNLSCLKFSEDFPITGVAKKDFGKGIVVTFTDKNNPVRRIELKKLKNITNCDDLLLFKKIDQPCIKVKKGQVGNMPNGTYAVALAYSVDNNIFSDWYSISNRIQLHSENNSNSLEISISGLDSEFQQFSLAVIGNYIDPVTKGVTKKVLNIGTFSTKVKTVSVTDFINSNYEEIPLSNLVIKKRAWNKAGIISSNSNYLMLGDLVGRPEQNYQLKAMSIETEYIIEQVPADYYERDGENIGYYADENYDFYIMGVYNTGEFTDRYHIPGRKATSRDRSIVSSADVYEYDQQFNDCEEPGRIQRWQVENTAGEVVPYNSEFKCDKRVYGRGEMGYFESTDLYPDNPAMFGDDANTPIRYHKFPDECKIPRYSTINGKTYINIKGVRFKNIPKFDDPDIIGYRILRSDRKGGNGTVVARGLLTNVRYYEDNSLKQTVMFSNYGVNDLRPDSFLSETQTAFRSGSERNYKALTGYYTDKFNFYSPHTLFEPRYTLGSELKIETEEIATVTGQFEKVYNHPQAKLMNQFSFWISAAVGFIESALVIMGKGDHVQGKQNMLSGLGVASGTAQIFASGQEYKISTVADLISLDVIGLIRSKALALDSSAIGLIRQTFTVIASLGLKIPYSILSGIIEADKTFQTIYNFTGYTDYVYQYNAYAKFDRSMCIGSGNKRRRLIDDAYYLPSDVVSIGDRLYNNYFREKSVFMEVNKPIAAPRTQDNTRQTATEFGVCGDITQSTSSTGSAYYATSKVINPNQYGSLGSANPVSLHSCTLPFSEEDETVSPILYGGDCIIARFQFQKRMQFFNQNMANTNFPPGTEFDYRKYRNIAYPRFWMDTTKYDFSELLSSNVVNFTRFSRTTTSKHNLDCKGDDGKSISRIDDAYMYLSNNSVLDFFVECDYNIHFREETEKPHYSKKNTSLSQIFRSDRLDTPEEFVVSRAYNDLYTTEIFSQQQRHDFDPLDPLPVEQSNSVIYSLPSFNLQEVDNWQYFLPGNYFNFRESDFGSLTGMHKVDQDRIIFLFSKSSPYISVGRDFLELEGTGRKITIGDAGLFAQEPREIAPTDNNYGACNSRYAFNNTHLGRYYPSERQGRIIQFSENLDDITRQGISYWCKNYMPIKLYEYFPDYPKIENPVGGVGYLSVFDSFNETIYITKRDFSPKREFVNDITYENGKFYYKGDTVISLRNSGYFNDISWTLSYSPADKSFVSWHDWHPDWVIQTDNHFLTVKDNGIWKHNESYDNFCTFYGIEYPFEWEPVSSSGQVIETVRSLEYLLEVYKYKNSGRDRFHVLNENFDRLIVYNTEQISPLLNLFHGNPNPEENLQYPKKNPTNGVSWDIAFFKEENKYRVNQFWDTVKDRGEFSRAEAHLFPTDESGYKNVLNPMAININKPEEERKKFRHYWNKFRLIKTASGPHKLIVKLLNVKKVVSFR